MKKLKFSVKHLHRKISVRRYNSAKIIIKKGEVILNLYKADANYDSVYLLNGSNIHILVRDYIEMEFISTNAVLEYRLFKITNKKR